VEPPPVVASAVRLMALAHGTPPPCDPAVRRLLPADPAIASGA
jgi:hypothetical protein